MGDDDDDDDENAAEATMIALIGMVESAERLASGNEGNTVGRRPDVVGNDG